MADCIHKMRYAFLPGNAADKQDIGNSDVHAIFCQCRCIRCLLVFGQIDAVVDDMNSVRIDTRIGAQNVGFRSL